MKRAHPTWGAGLIRLQLQQQFPDQPLPQKRAIERWIQKAGLQPTGLSEPQAMLHGSHLLLLLYL